MIELNRIHIPKSVNSMDTLVTRRSLMCLMQVAYVFDKIKKEKTNTSLNFLSMKRVGPNLEQLGTVINEKKDRNYLFFFLTYNETLLL